jgi:hypothetical protein
MVGLGLAGWRLHVGGQDKGRGMGCGGERLGERGDGQAVHAVAVAVAIQAQGGVSWGTELPPRTPPTKRRIMGMTTASAADRPGPLLLVPLPFAHTRTCTWSIHPLSTLYCALAARLARLPCRLGGAL